MMRLRNTYYLLRHGFSVGNEQGLIVSSPEIGLHQFGLTERGRDEIRRCVDLHRDELVHVARIYSSDFRRTLETAQIVSEALSIPVETSSLLRERYFGDWDGLSNRNYEEVWRQDLIDAAQVERNVESVRAVADRMTESIRQIEEAGSGQTFLVVSHGDPLQILLASLAGVDLRFHRSVPAIGTGQLRRLE